MKITVGIPWRLDWTQSGLAFRVKTCFGEIANRGVEVKIYCLGPESKDGKISISRVHVKETTENNCFSPLLNSIAFSHEFAKLIDKEECDVLHCFNTTTLFLKDRRFLFQTANPTYAFTLDAVRDEYPRTSKYQSLINYYTTITELEKTEYEKANFIIVDSDIVKKNLQRYYDFDSDQIKIIPNGISPEEYSFKRDPSKQERLKIVLFPSNIHVMKGFHYLVDAMEEVRKTFPETILMVCGRIRHFEYDLYKDLIERKRKSSGIVLAGFVSRKKLFEYYQMADVCCIPLLYGTMSNAILEAVAHGLPIVTTVHSGFPEIDQVGVEVPSKNSDAIAEGIMQLLSNPKLWKRKSNNALKTIKKFFWTDIAKQFAETYEQITE